MKQNQVKRYLSIFSVVVIAVLIAAFALGCKQNDSQTTKGETTAAKTITVEIVFSDENQKTVEIQTDAEFLKGALDEKNLIEGETSSYGFYVKKVDGVAADDAQKQWWCFTKNGEALMTGVDSTPIKNGDKFEITLSVY